MNNYFEDTSENQPKLGEMLVRDGHLTEEQLDTALDQQDSEPIEQSDEIQNTYLDSKGSRNHGIIILLAVCVVGILGVYLIGTRQTIETTKEDKAVESTVDVVIAKLSNGKNSKDLDDTAKMVQTFYDYPLNQQVSLDELKKNPFSRLTESEVTDTPVKKVVKKKVDIKAELQKKIAKYNLQAVIQADGGAKCMINGDVYDLGNNIDEDFTIAKISSGSVTLESKGHEFKLEI